MTATVVHDEVGRRPLTIAGHIVEPHSPVLVSRPLKPEADPTAQPRFGDDVWDLDAALTDRHSDHRAIHWDRYPAPLREATKCYLFALLAATDATPRLPYARSAVPSIKTIRAELPYLRRFLWWLTDQGISAFGDVTVTHLNAYLRHVQDLAATSSTVKRCALLAVQRLHAYRDLLPESCQLPAPRPWGGASAAQLARDEGPRLGENRTPRIHPDVMEPLLSAALLVTDLIAQDLLSAARSLLAMRRLARHIAAERRRESPGPKSRTTIGVHQQLERVLATFTDQNHPLPGRLDRHNGGEAVLDVVALAVACGLDREVLATPWCQQRIAQQRLFVAPDLLRVTQFSPTAGGRWRTEPIEADELLQLLRHLRAGCFLIVAYLSGARTGEVLNLRRDCIRYAPTLQVILMMGQRSKTRLDDRRGAVPWSVTEHTARAVSLLEQLTEGPLLFPGSAPALRGDIEESGSRSRGVNSINRDLNAFIAWFNDTVAPAVQHPVIPPDDHGPIVAPRLRRTLAWHIVRRPGGTVAGATQYGHLHPQITQGYAGPADTGFLDEVSFEEFLLRAEQLHDDRRRLADGEHVSGPSAQLYGQRTAAAEAHFAGTTVTTRSQLRAMENNSDLSIHHGELLTCVWRPESAACRTPDDTTDSPHWPRCRAHCTNIARTDRDIVAVTQRLRKLDIELAGLGLPEPLHRRVQERAEHYRSVITEHHCARPAQ